jgi:DNA-binding NtrC family response regulator
MSPTAKPVFLIADDDEKIAFAFRQTFGREAEVIAAEDGQKAIDLLREARPTLAFLDITMPVKDGFEVLREVADLTDEIPIIVITGYGTMKTAIQAMQLGAFDYITKPLDVQHLRLVVSRALEMVRLKNEVKDLKSERWRETHVKDEIIGRHPSMQEVFKKIGMVALTPNTTTVLITGESGTGKELVAKAIHGAGPDPSGWTEPFLGINCSALPENLLESELFGHERGAFTGAVKQQRGKFAAAEKGTIFLDEIGDMPLQLQQKLLRVLEAREFSPIGSTRRIPVRARFIAATNKDLKQLMQEGRFREDLYYRLNVFTIHLPPLRERKTDIPLLVDFFIKRQNEQLNRRVKAIADEALQVLLNYDFPGNVRELQNMIISAMTQEKGEVLTLRSFHPYLNSPEPSSSGKIPIVAENMRAARRHVMQQFEEQFVRHLLTLTGGNVTHAAERAGIERQSFQRLMRRYGIRSQDFRT